MRVLKRILGAVENYFPIVHIIREASATAREVQCEGDRDETEEGREKWRAAGVFGPAGFKHRAAAASGGEAKEKGILLNIGPGFLLGAHLSEGEPTDLGEGDTAIYSADGAQVRCKGAIVEIGSGPGGFLMRLDFFQTQWNAGPRANHLLHKHTASMPGPGSTGTPDTDLGPISDDVKSDEGHKVK